MVIRRAYWINLLLGVLFLLAVATGWIGGQRFPGLEGTPVPYTFTLDEEATGQREDGYHLVGTLNKVEDCLRIPQPAGFSVETVGSDERADWYDAEGRDLDESRSVGSAVLHIVLDLPTAHEAVQIWTAHACPPPEVALETGEPVIYVRTLLHEIPGNIAAQRVRSAGEPQ